MYIRTTECTFHLLDTSLMDAVVTTGTDFLVLHLLLRR